MIPILKKKKKAHLFGVTILKCRQIYSSYQNINKCIQTHSFIQQILHSYHVLHIMQAQSLPSWELLVFDMFI